jgi:hypothetical protein
MNVNHLQRAAFSAAGWGYGYVLVHIITFRGTHIFVRYGPRSKLRSLWNMQNSNSLDSSVGEEIKQHNVITHRRQFSLCLLTIRDLLYSTHSAGSSLLLPTYAMLICVPKLNMPVNLRNNCSWLYWLLLLCTACPANITVIETRLGDASNISSSCWITCASIVSIVPDLSDTADSVFTFESFCEIGAVGVALFRRAAQSVSWLNYVAD